MVASALIDALDSPSSRSWHTSLSYNARNWLFPHHEMKAPDMKATFLRCQNAPPPPHDLNVSTMKPSFRAQDGVLIA